ncbi:MAG: hypothetical protein P1V19_25705 [Gimesia sp.]|nr:hypothetical protein [Gimesia sp.]
MTTLQTCAQIHARSSLSKNKRMGFDVEFGRKKVKTWIFCLLWLLLGNFGAHIFYMWFKDPAENYEGAGFFVPAYLLCWIKILGRNESQSEVASVVLFIGVLIHGVVVLASGMLREMNDRIAREVASTL